MCEDGYGGPTCEPLCPAECSGHGYCEAPGRCVCAGGWGGPLCAEEACPGRVWREGAWSVCSGHGQCLAHGECRCDDGWEGSGCELAP